MAAKSAILMTLGGGAYYTMPRSDALYASKRLSDYFDTTVTVLPAPGIDSEEWVSFSLPKKHHASALLYLNAWRQGGSDGLDAHYNRGISDYTRRF